jgi:hypothetical protein
MRTAIKKIITKIVNNNILWPFIKPFAKLGAFALSVRQKPPVAFNYEADPLAQLFKDKIVLNGPFKGMKYPSFSSAGSSFFPKLLGSYERELHGVIAHFLTKDYTEVLDIGSAEGYYAIGLALHQNCKKIYAYDTDLSARTLCAQMARLNKVENKIELKETCTAEELKNFDFTGRGLIICDCEGYEQNLFDDDNIQNLKKCDLLIETHDFIDLSISEKLIGLFEKTHHIQIIKSIDDIEKVKTYTYEEINGLTRNEKMNLLREWRPAIMEWLICTPIND